MQLRHCCHGQLDSTDIGAEQRTHHMDGAQEGRQSSAEHMKVAPADMDTLEKTKQKNTEDKQENYLSSRTKVWHVCFQMEEPDDIHRIT